MVEVVESEVRKESEQREKSFAVETEEQTWNKLQHENLNHKKRIKDLIGLAQESRERIDALLGRKTTSRLEFDDNVTPVVARTDSRRSSRDSTSSRQSDYDRADNDRVSDNERSSTRKHRASRDDVTEQRTIAVRTDGSGGGNVSVSMTPSAERPEKSGPTPPKVKPKPPKPGAGKVAATTTSVDMSPKLMKKPFKFGMVSLQVKLDD